MRIIAGEFASRKLAALKGEATRPTLDKVKEAVFSSLGGMFDGGSVLDLYSGSGAIGLEALSRGMDQAVLVDASRAAVHIIRENVSSLGCEDRCRILCMKDFRALAWLHEKGMQFDLVYLDPPYRKQRNREVLAYLDEHQMVKQGGRVVIEALKEEDYHEPAGSLSYYKESVYGIMKITYYRNA
jgi:16S rRNA (guanine966-N2)-methyltransferase